MFTLFVLLFILHYYFCVIAIFFCVPGTVKGGTQLQEFKNVGTRLFGMNSELHLPHMSSIYITVVATNGAGYKTVSYSNQIVVDLTPPELVDVNDGLTDGW